MEDLYLANMDSLFFLLIFTFFCGQTCAQTDKYAIPLQTPEDCRRGAGNSYHEFYDVTQMVCTPCTQNSTVQTVSADGLRCVCTELYRIVQFLGNPGLLTCTRCPDGQVSSLDGWNCVTCTTTGAPPSGECPACGEEDQLEADRDLVGDWLLDGGNDMTLTCVTCLNDTLPDDKSARCVRCDQQLSVQPSIGCECPQDRMSGGLCFGSDDDLIREDILDYTVRYEDKDRTDVEVVSEHIKLNLKTALSACTNFTSLDSNTRLDYSNLTSCQHLANMCVMTLYSAPSANSLQNPCSLYLGLAVGGGVGGFPVHEAGYRTGTNNLQSWKANMPWIYYVHDRDDPADDVLEDADIDQTYSKDDNLLFKTLTYDLTGAYLGIRDLEATALMLCGGGDKMAQEAFRFGTEYRKRCWVSKDRLFDATDVPLFFHELYLQYQAENGETRLQAVPILLKNYTIEGETPNRKNDREQWQLLRRYFVLDQVTGMEENFNTPTVVRYLEKMKFIIPQQSNVRSGLIYTPYVEMTYNYVTESEYGQGERVKVLFIVQYKTDLTVTSRNIHIAIGVMGAVAVVLSIIQTANWNKREGKIAIDCVSILRCVMFLAANVSNAFFLTMLGYSLWMFIVFKAQNVMYIVPDDGTEYHLKAFIGSAFALKFLHLIQVLVTQCRVDIFFVDWEKPKRPLNDENRILPPRNETESYMKESGPPVAIWRGYLVANEWVELMTLRKVKPFWQLVFMLIILHVAGVENLARVETDSRVSYAADEHKPEFNMVFRFALSASIYIGLAIVQWVFHTAFWIPCIDDPVMNFFDLCSIANVSVFAIAYEQYGYYIHGRSIHGIADVGLKDMYVNMSREEDGMVSHRGLVPGDDEQCFEMFIPKKLRSEYNRILFSVYRQRREAGRQSREEGKLHPETEKRLDAYMVINKFMQNYIDHNLQNVDYTVTKKNLWERIMDTEMIDDFDTGYFFIDPSHRFDRLMFYGQETVLVLFEILVFTVVDFAGGGFILAAIITYIMNRIVHTIRLGVGKKNVASKTMTDSRFLI